MEVRLVSAGENKIAIIKLIREITGLSLAESKDIADNAPTVFTVYLPDSDYGSVQRDFENLGAVLQKASDSISSTPPPIPVEESNAPPPIPKATQKAPEVAIPQITYDGALTLVSSGSKTQTITLLQEFFKMEEEQAKIIVDNTPMVFPMVLVDIPLPVVLEAFSKIGAVLKEGAIDIPEPVSTPPVQEEEASAFVIESIPNEQSIETPDITFESAEVPEISTQIPPVAAETPTIDYDISTSGLDFNMPTVSVDDIPSLSQEEKTETPEETPANDFTTAPEATPPPVNVNTTIEAEAPKTLSATAKQKYISYLEGRQRSFAGGTVGLLFGVIGAVTYGYLAFQSSFGSMAVLIITAIAIGYAMRKTGKGVTRSIGALGGFITLISCLFAAYMKIAFMQTWVDGIDVFSAMGQVPTLLNDSFIWWLAFEPITTIVMIAASLIGYRSSYKKIQDKHLLALAKTIPLESLRLVKGNWSSKREKNDDDYKKRSRSNKERKNNYEKRKRRYD